MKKNLFNWLKILMVAFYFFGGINHFLNPDFYIPLIPDYLPKAELLNLISGAAEILGAIGLLVPKTQKFSAWGIAAMLVAFIPSHIYFIQIGSCIPDVMCVDEWIGWVRLILIHPLLIYWAWIYTRP